MTIIPNLFITGVLTILASLSLIAWSAVFVQRNNGGTIQVLFSFAMLLVGGGFAPPIMGLLAGVAGTRIRSPSNWWQTHLPVTVQRLFAKLWPWIFGVCTVNGVFLVIGSVVLVYLFGLNNPNLFISSFFFAVVSLILTIITGIGYDLQVDERCRESQINSARKA